MALVVVLTNGDPESVLRPGLLDAVRRAGAVRLTIVGDGVLTGIVLEGWALSAEAAASGRRNRTRQRPDPPPSGRYGRSGRLAGDSPSSWRDRMTRPVGSKGRSGPESTTRNAITTLRSVQ